MNNVRVEISNHMCKRYIERILNITNQVNILKYLKSHQYEIYTDILKLYERSTLIYEGNFDDDRYHIAKYYLYDNILLIFSDNIGVTIYKATSEKNLDINTNIQQMLSLNKKINDLINNKQQLFNSIIINQGIKTFIESDILNYGGEVKNYLKNKQNEYMLKLQQINDDINNVNKIIEDKNKLLLSVTKKVIKGKWINVSDEELINLEINKNESI